MVQLGDAEHPRQQAWYLRPSLGVFNGSKCWSLVDE